MGVPQGSILGSLLFSIYVNDLPNAISSTDINMYADDMEVHLVIVTFLLWKRPCKQMCKMFPAVAG